MSENKIPNRTVWVRAYLFPKLVPRVNINQSELWDLFLNRHESSLPQSTQSALPQYHPSEEKYNKDINWSLNQTVNDSKTFNQNLMVLHANFFIFTRKRWENINNKSKVDQCILYCVHVSSINSFFVSSRQGIIFWFVADLIQWGRKCPKRNPILMRCLLFSPPLAHLWCNEVTTCFLFVSCNAPEQQTSYDDGSDASLILLLPFFF